MKKSRLVFFVFGTIMLGLFIAVLWLVFKPRGEQLTIRLGCNDYVLLVPENESGAMELCDYQLQLSVNQLKQNGYEPNDCRYIRSEVVSSCPGLGQELVCTFECGP
jgi:hypothetical protein